MSYDISPSLSDLLHSVWQSLGSFMLLQMSSTLPMPLPLFHWEINDHWWLNFIHFMLGCSSKVLKEIWFTRLSILLKLLFYVAGFQLTFSFWGAEAITSCNGWVIFHCVCVPYVHYPVLCWWTFRLFPCLNCKQYCKECCNEHWILLGHMYTWTHVYFSIMFSLGICPGVGLQDHMVVLFFSV